MMRSDAASAAESRLERPGPKRPSRERRLNPRSARDSGESLTLGSALDFMRLLWAVDHGLHSTSKYMAATLGVTGPQRLVIRIIAMFPGISAGELAHVLHMHPSTMTGILKRLGRAGFVSRTTPKSDARRAEFQLTKSGKRINQINAGTVWAAVRRVLGRFPSTNIVATREVLDALANELTRDDA